MSAHRARLPDGRVHFQHGPIDLVIGVDGEPQAVAAALERAWRRFGPLLDELVAELACLRRCAEPRDPPRGEVARRMHAAVLPFRPRFVTPMAAVAGAVADAIVACLAVPGVRRASVNNGGDIALWLAPDAPAYAIGVAIDRRGAPQPDPSGDAGRDRPASPAVEMPASLSVAAGDPWRGVATSGWRGRSLSLGIADSVTVLAADGARADAAATLIANAVDVVHPSICRAPASSLRDGSDLGERLATVDVPVLPDDAVCRALEAGCAEARRCVDAGLVGAVLLALQGRWRAVGGLAPRLTQGTPSVSGEPRPRLARHAPSGHGAMTPSGSPA
ncbi:MAG: UPF0280 family protein [Burkholderiales bacterium]|jgi:ApbE superfamily uncharacterized protein (UPF0280 family)